MYNFNKYINKDNIEDILNKTDEIININIEENQDKNNIIGIHIFYFELIIIKNIYY